MKKLSGRRTLILTTGDIEVMAFESFLHMVGSTVSIQPTVELKMHGGGRTGWFHVY